MTTRPLLCAALLVLGACDGPQEDPGDGRGVEGLDPGEVCDQRPPALDVSLRRQANGVVPHWALADGCVPVTYDSALAGDADTLRTALDAWSVECSQLCFETPELDDAALDADAPDRRLHLRQVSGADAELAAEAIFDAERGTVAGAEVRVPVDHVLTVNDLLWAIGRVSGLGAAGEGVASVMGPPDAALTAPTEADIETMCTLYGDPPLCGD